MSILQQLLQIQVTSDYRGIQEETVLWYRKKETQESQRNRMLPLFDTTSQRNSIICSDSAQGKTGVEILRL